MNSISKLALLLLVSVSISACAGFKKSNPSTAETDVEDITVPPVVEKDTTPVETVAAEGETVSFDEWRKRREAEKQKLDQDQ